MFKKILTVFVLTSALASFSLLSWSILVPEQEMNFDAFIEKASQSLLVELSNEKRILVEIDIAKRKFHGAEPQTDASDPMFRSAAVLDAFSNEDLFFFFRGQVYIYVSTIRGQSAFYILGKSDFERKAASWPFKFQDKFDSKCIALWSTGCWVTQQTFLEKNRSILLIFSIFILFLSLLLLLILTLKEKQRAEEMLRISSMAISHEIRHPVSVLALIIERLREDYDQLSEPFQRDFFQITAEIERLKSLVEASNVFLQRKPGEKIEWNLQHVPSIARWGEVIAESYNVEFQMIGADRSFRTDIYWLQVAIENLIKNALKYGSPPIVLKFESDRRDLRVSVIDQGSGNSKKENDTGLGFGHVMVDKISRTMGGSGIRSYHAPTCYSFTAKELSNEVNSTY